MDELIKQAESLGIKVFKSWDEDRLKAEIEAAIKANEATDAIDSEEPSLADDLPDPEPEIEKPSVSSQIMMQVDVSDEPAMTVINLKENPMRSLGLDGYGSKVFAFKEAADEALMRKIRRGVELGLLKVEL